MMTLVQETGVEGYWLRFSEKLIQKRRLRKYHLTGKILFRWINVSFEREGTEVAFEALHLWVYGISISVHVFVLELAWKWRRDLIFWFIRGWFYFRTYYKRT